MSRRRRIILSVIVACVISVAVVGVLRWWRDYPVHHFAVVREGVLYRSGQPDEGQLAFLSKRYRIRTIVNLRGQAPDKEWYRSEAAFCQGHGIEFVSLAMDETQEASANIQRVLDLLGDPRRQPALIHCEAGSARTGFAAAAFRIVLDGWSYEKAMEEARGLDFPTPHKDIDREYVRILRELAARKAGSETRPGSAPASRP